MRKFAIVALAVALIMPSVATAELEMNITPQRLNVYSQGKMMVHIKGDAEELGKIESVKLVRVAITDDLGNVVGEESLPGIPLALEDYVAGAGQRKAKLERSDFWDHVIGYLKNTKGVAVEDGYTLALVAEATLEGEPVITVYWDSREYGDPLDPPFDDGFILAWVFGGVYDPPKFWQFAFDGIDTPLATWMNIGLDSIMVTSGGDDWTIRIESAVLTNAIEISAPVDGDGNLVQYFSLDLVGYGLEGQLVDVNIYYTLNDAGDIGLVQFDGFELADGPKNFGSDPGSGGGSTVELTDNIVIIERGERTKNPNTPN